ncbi:thioesterase [Streptococcus pneumoniae]|nr:thioesterase [Streptococcus pneumoniae]
MKDFHFDAISAFENYEIEKMRDGHVVVTTNPLSTTLRQENSTMY